MIQLMHSAVVMATIWFDSGHVAHTYTDTNTDTVTYKHMLLFECANSRLNAVVWAANRTGLIHTLSNTHRHRHRHRQTHTHISLSLSLALSLARSHTNTHFEDDWLDPEVAEVT